MLKFAVEAIVVLLPVKTKLKGETIFPGDGLCWPEKPIYPLVARASASAGPQASVDNLGVGPHLNLHAELLVQI